MQPAHPDSSPEGQTPADTDEQAYTTIFPASFGQRRLWFLTQMDPRVPLYNMPNVRRLAGRIDTDALGRALNEIVARHESLRTAFAIVDGELSQLIAPTLRVPLPVVNLTHLPPPERERVANQLASDEALLPFDLTRRPLLRAQLLRMSDEDSILLVTMHHTVSDGWSMQVFFGELTTLYNCFLRGEESPLEELPLQYADYAVWQHEWLQGETLDEQLSYWRKQLAGAPSTLQLPLDYPRPPVSTYRGSGVRLVLSESLTNALRELSRRKNVTLFMTLLAAFKVLLWRYTGQADILIGSPVANRAQSEVEGVIGFFINMLMLRTCLDETETFARALARVQQTCVGAYEHQEIPFEKLVEELNPERDATHTPMFQVSFNLQDRKAQGQRLSEARVQDWNVEASHTIVKFDLYLALVDAPDCVNGVLEYRTDVFKQATARRMVAHYRTLLEAIVADPERPVAEIELLSAEERRQQLFEWNQTGAPYPQDRCVNQLYEEWAERTPQAVALVAGDERLTYRELNERANRLAHYLRSLGVGPESRVGLLLERGAGVAVGLLAVLKAGGAYVPLDAQYPPQRLAFMLEDAGATVLLTQRRLAELVPGHAMRVVCLDDADDLAAITSQSATNPAQLSTPRNLVYVNYTSGSTGRPKGVAVEHRSLVNLIKWYQRAYEVTPDDRLSQVAGLSFDASGFEIWPSLTGGAALYIADDETRIEPARLLRWLKRERITLCLMPTPLAEAALGEEWPEGMALRWLHTGGDRLHRFDVEGRGWRLSNQYGPTEATVLATRAVVGRVEEGKLPSIGRPMSNTQVYVLDARMEPVPVGVTGELFIGGDGVARGYLGRPGLTAERFVPDPFGGGAGGRLYRTGDLVRYQAEGEIEFLGRADDQVKIRGFRIELGEIESVLVEHEAVSACVVVARGEGEEQKRLVGYVTTVGGVTGVELRRYVAGRVPEYMVPAVVVVLDVLPLTANGKVDKRALPAPEEMEGAAEGEGYAEPRTPTEMLLADIWRGTLGVERVGGNDNFFELGGHSLLATRVVAQVAQVFRVEVPLRDVFLHPTLAGLAARIELVAGGPEAQQNVPPIRPTARGERLPVSYNQEGQLFREWRQSLRRVKGFHFLMHVGFQLTGPLDGAALEQSLGELIRRHESLRTNFLKLRGPLSFKVLRPLFRGLLKRKAVQRRFRTITGSHRFQSDIFHQVISPDADLRLSVFDLRGLPDAEREAEYLRLVCEETQKPFDYAHGAMLRAALFKLEDASHRLLLTLPHLVGDGWSVRILLRELFTLYAAFSKGEPSPLPTLAVQYADFVQWQRERLQGEVLEEMLNYWERQLKGFGLFPELRLPFARPRPEVRSYKGESLSVAVPPDLSKSIRDLCSRQGVTLYMFCLAVLKVLLARYTGEQRIGVFTPFANRNRAETQALVGWFSNMHVLVTDLSGDPRFSALLERVREVVLGAHAHHEIPYPLLYHCMLERLKDEELPASIYEFPYIQFDIREQEPGGARQTAAGSHTLVISPAHVPNDSAEGPLSILLIERTDGLLVEINYSTDEFVADDIRRMLAHFLALLGAVAEDPDVRLSELLLRDAN